MAASNIRAEVSVGLTLAWTRPPLAIQAMRSPSAHAFPLPILVLIQPWNSGGAVYSGPYPRDFLSLSARSPEMVAGGDSEILVSEAPSCGCEAPCEVVWIPIYPSQ